MPYQRHLLSPPVDFLPRQKVIPLPALCNTLVVLNPLLRCTREKSPAIDYDLYSPPTSARLNPRYWSFCSRNWGEEPAMSPSEIASITIRVHRRGVELNLPPIVVFPASIHNTTVTIADVLRSVNSCLIRDTRYQSFAEEARWNGLYASHNERDVWILELSAAN
ncbi:hypothetical protein CPC08DRAFT_725371 [Agrocybe pediades]|nr:hypothetical protein CPC08DRAFT_725371 [Agrocybe pediades]